MHIRLVCHYEDFTTVGDISVDGLTHFVGGLKAQGKSARTIQAYLTSLKSFTKWLAEHHKLPRDPLAGVKKPNPQADRRRERRMLLPEEWSRLRAATLAGPMRYGMSDDERTLLYSAAIQTGLRSGELRSLTRGRLFLNADPPYVTCKAGSTKNRKNARQYIQPETAADLKAHVATKSPKAAIFGLPHESNLARMLRTDLAEARGAWLKEAKDDPQEFARRKQSDFLSDVNHDGEIADFHSLRTPAVRGWP